MLNNNNFNVSPQCSFEFRDALRNLVDELKEQEGLYPQTLGEYLNKVGEILFLEGDDYDEADESKVIRLMTPISDYLVNEEFRYSMLNDSDDDVELE